MENKNWNCNVWVTGGAGFIGSNLVNALQEAGANVLVIDDFRSGDCKNLQHFKGDLVSESLDKLKFDSLLADFGQPNVIFHLASITDTTVTDHKKMVYDNVEGFRSLLKMCLKHDIRVIYASSAAVYGVKNAGKMQEIDPMHPQNAYAFSKMLLDRIALPIIEKRPNGFIVGLRFFNVYGPNEAHKGHSSSMIWQLANQMRAGKSPRIFKFGEQKRDFVYVKDVVQALLTAARKSKSGIYNVGSGNARSFNDVIHCLNQTLGTSLEPEYFDNPYGFYQPFTEASLDLIKNNLGYEPLYSLEEGIADYFQTALVSEDIVVEAI